jgi:hypothetical protein
VLEIEQALAMWGGGEAAHRNITTEFDAAKMENWRPFNEKPRPMGIKGRHRILPGAAR